jgi:hypothetical protein
VRAPFGVEVVQVAPPTVVFVFEPTAVKRCRSRRRSRVIRLPGYVVGTMTVDPPTVEITGPESAVKQATEAVTETVALDGAVADVTESVTSASSIRRFE